MEPYEWAYWYEGKAAEQDIMARTGAFSKRPARCATADPTRHAWGLSPAGTPSWTKTQYMVRKWNEFIAA